MLDLALFFKILKTPRTSARKLLISVDPGWGWGILTPELYQGTGRSYYQKTNDL